MLMLLLSHVAVAGAADVAVAVAVAASRFLLAAAAATAPDSGSPAWELGAAVTHSFLLPVTSSLISSRLAICCWLALLVFSCRWWASLLTLGEKNISSRATPTMRWMSNWGSRTDL